MTQRPQPSLIWLIVVGDLYHATALSRGLEVESGCHGLTAFLSTQGWMLMKTQCVFACGNYPRREA